MNSKAPLLAVDVGLRTAMACFNVEGRLVWLQSRRFNSRRTMKRGIISLLREMPPVSRAVLEGGGTLTKVWQRVLDQRQVESLVVYAEDWRSALLHPRERRNGNIAKKTAQVLYGSIVSWSGLDGTCSSQHDAAEAVLCGFWWLWRQGQISDPPPEIKARL